MEDGTGCTGTYDGRTSREIHPNSHTTVHRVNTVFEIRSILVYDVCEITNAPTSSQLQVTLAYTLIQMSTSSNLPCK